MNEVTKLILKEAISRNQDSINRTNRQIEELLSELKYLETERDIKIKEIQMLEMDLNK